MYACMCVCVLHVGVYVCFMCVHEWVSVYINVYLFNFSYSTFSSCFPPPLTLPKAFPALYWPNFNFMFVLSFQKKEVKQSKQKHSKIDTYQNKNCLKQQQRIKTTESILHWPTSHGHGVCPEVWLISPVTFIAENWLFLEGIIAIQFLGRKNILCNWLPSLV